jgi:hypothetical protein
MRSLHVPCVTLVMGLLLGVVTSVGAQTARTAPTSPRGSGSGFAPGANSGFGRGAHIRQMPACKTGFRPRSRHPRRHRSSTGR